jgi:hypothetical protein
MTKLFAVAALALVAACSGTRPTMEPANPGTSGGTVPRSPGSALAVPPNRAGTASPGTACGAMFAPGVASPAVATSVTCETAAGPLLVPAIRCRDGGVLWQVGGAGTDGWAFAGQPFHPNSDLQDPAYLAALRQCSGG